jgi:hypothetical protein
MVALSSTAGAQSPNPFTIPQFSATMVMSMQGSGELSMKVYKSGDKMRQDLPQMGGMPGSGQGYMLTMLSSRTVFAVMSGMCMQLSSQESPGRPDNRPNPFSYTGSVQRKDIGTEVVDGHPTKITQVTVASGTDYTQTLKVWLATDLHEFPLRVEIPTSQGTARISYKDVSLSSPAASLFEQPTNCRQMPAGPNVLGMPGMPH